MPPNAPAVRTRYNPAVKLAAHGATHPGRRASNEDALLVDTSLGLFVVADGMGGHRAGEVAARLAIEAIRDFIERSGDSSGVTWPFGFDPHLSLDANRLRTAVQLANRRVLDASESRADYTGMGTTVVGVLATRDRLVFVSVGDSRVYLLQRGAMTQLTRDDSWVAAVLARDPAMTESALAQHPMRHVLTSVVGARADTEPRVDERPFVPGDAVLLCSDGLHGSLGADDIIGMLDSDGGVETIASGLVEAALARGASDNVTAVVVRREA